MKFIYCGYGSEGSFSIHSPFLFRGSRLQRGIPRVLDLQTARSAAACESAATEDQVKSRQDRTNPTVRVFTLILVFLSLSSNRLLFGQDKSLLVQWSPDCTWTTQRDLVLSLLLTEFPPPRRSTRPRPAEKMDGSRFVSLSIRGSEDSWFGFGDSCVPTCPPPLAVSGF